MNTLTPLSPSTASILAQLAGSPEARGSKQSTFNSGLVHACASVVDSSGVVAAIDQWRLQDRRADAGPGGRRACIDFRALLAVMLMLQLHGEPPLLTNVTDALRHRLTEESRTALGLREDTVTVSAQAVYHRVARAFTRMTDLFEPNPGVAGRRRTVDAHLELMAGVDPDARAERQQRAVWLSNALLHASYMLIPRDVRRRWNGNLVIDGTKVEVFGRRGSTARSQRQRSDATISPEPAAGWYHRDGNHGGFDDDNVTPIRGRGAPKNHWAYEAHLGVMFNEGTGPAPFPRLVLGVSLDAPAGRPGENAQTVLRSLNERGIPAGILVADRAYLPGAKQEVLMLPAKAMGYGLAMDYRQDQLGIRANVNGAILVEGAWYCPGMPQTLIDASKEYLEDHDYKLYARRIDQRRIYQLQPKELPNDKGTYRLRCPALGKHAQVKCPLRAPVAGPVDLAMPRTRTAVHQVPQHPGTVCTNDDSVSFTADAGAKYAQEHPYKSKEWLEVYQPGRSTVESVNAYVKSSAHEDLDNSGRRRVRGYAKQLLLISLALLSANVRKLRSFGATGEEDDSAVPAPRRLRSTPTSDLRTHLPDRHAPPLVIPGVA